MNVLITGGAGYIGSHILKLFLKQGDFKISIVDNLCNSNLFNINVLKKYGEFNFFNIGLDCDLNEIFKKEKFNLVIHLAAFIDVDHSNKEPLKYYLNNVGNLIKILDYCKQFEVNKFIFSSTAGIYKENKNKLDENSEICPINPYTKSKFMAENIIRDYANSNPEFKFVILRYFNVAGADKEGLIGQNSLKSNHIIKKIIDVILKKEEKLFVFGDDYDTKDGTCIRDYIHVDDIALSHLSMIRYLQNNQNEIFNVGYGQGFSVKDLISCAKKISGVDFNVSYVSRRLGDPCEIVANCNKIKKLTDFRPQNNDLEFIIRSSLNWGKRI